MKRTMILTGSSTLVLAAALTLGCASDGYETSHDYDRMDRSEEVAINDTRDDNLAEEAYEETKEAAKATGEAIEEGYEETGEAIEEGYEETVDVAEEVYPDRTGERTDRSLQTDTRTTERETAQRPGQQMNVQEVRTRAGDNFYARWQTWEQGVSDSAITAKNQLQREIEAIDREIKSILAEQDESADALYALEQQRYNVEQQLDRLFVQGDKALNSINFETMRTAQYDPNQTREQNEQTQPEDIDAIIIMDVEGVEQQ